MPDLETLILIWDQLNSDLKKLKKKEMELRLEICESLLEGKEVGTHNYKFHGLFAKAVKKNSISLLPEELELLYDDLSEDERDCISFKPMLSQSKYKQLEDSSILDECIIVKPATPTLSVTIDTDE